MKKYLIASILPVLISGCGLTPIQKQQVSQFATATESISVSSQSRFKDTRDKIIEIERRRLILRNQAPPTTLDLDGGISATGIATQIATLDTLKSYGELLNELASNDQSDRLGKSATEFSTSFESARQLGDQNYSLSDDKKEAFEGVVTIAGSWFVEHKKRKSLSKIVKAYTPEVNTLADLLVHDLVLKGDSFCINKNDRKSNTVKTGVIDHYCTSAKALRKASSDVLKGKDYTFREREFAYDSYVLSQEAIEDVKLLSKSGSKSIAKFKKANEELLNSIKNEKYTSEEIKSYSKQVKELQTLIKVLSD